jgi:hypothetical protein
MRVDDEQPCSIARPRRMKSNRGIGQFEIEIVDTHGFTKNSLTDALPLGALY